jgi:SAM-dependent methyltransferase
LARLARANPLPLRFVQGELSNSRLPSQYFDLITFWHSLEHHVDPVSALTQAKAYLRPGGFVVAEVPNSASLIAKIFGANWLGWDLPRHLVHFAPSTLRRVAKGAGFATIRVLPRYTLNPIALSPILASLSIWHQRRRKHRRMRLPAYHRWDGAGRIALAAMNYLERLVGGNGLLLIGRSPFAEARRVAA